MPEPERRHRLERESLDEPEIYAVADLEPGEAVAGVVR